MEKGGSVTSEERVGIPGKREAHGKLLSKRGEEGSAYEGCTFNVDIVTSIGTFVRVCELV